MRFLFRGKSGKQWSLSMRDRRVARVIRSCQELPGQHLFEYRDRAGLFAHVLNRISVSKCLKRLRQAGTARGQEILYTEYLRFFAFLPCAIRSKGRQIDAQNSMLQCNMIKWRDVRCPKAVIVPKRNAASMSVAKEKNIISPLSLSKHSKLYTYCQ